MIDSNETITAIRYEDLQSKLQALYDSKQRSLETVATRCAFYDANGATGTWMGVCNGGRANGTGVGVVQTSGGNAVEYYGYASGGVANGPGLLIVHAPRESYTLEGNFSQGQANGDMRVTEGGKGDKYRRYQAGRDVGRASAAPASPFSGSAPVVSTPQFAPRITAPAQSVPTIKSAPQIAPQIAPPIAPVVGPTG